MTKGRSERDQRVYEQIEKAYSTWSSGIFRFAMRLCGNREDAEDVVVETFTQAYRCWDKFVDTGSRRDWLYGIALNCIRTNRRRWKNRVEQLVEETPAPQSNNLNLIVLYEEIAKLPLLQRQAVLLVKGEGVTCREAAEILGRPLGTILYEVHRAMQTMRAAMTSESGDLEHASRLCEAEL